MSHHRVELDGVEYTYPDGTPALRGVSFRLTHGESVGLVGENGAGKSTVLQHLNGCLFPAKGVVRIGEDILSSRNAAILRRHIGTVFQDPDDQLFMPTVLEDVAFGPLNHDLPEDDARSRALAALEAVGVAHLASRPPQHLSGGEKRAVAIATVLALSPDVLVLDEPSAGLDPRGRRRLIALLKGFSHTKLIATHDLDLVLELCPRTIVLHQGRVAADGLTSAIMANSKLLEACGLEKPLRMETVA